MNDAVSVEQTLSTGAVHELPKVWEDFNSGETYREVSPTGSDQARVPRHSSLQGFQRAPLKTN